VTGIPQFFRQRLPFLGLLLAAIAGILTASLASWPSGVFLAGTAVFLCAGIVIPRGPWIFVAVACAFACVHVWQTRESTSWRLAREVGTGRQLVEATGEVVSEISAHGSTRERFIMRVNSLKMAGKTLRPAAGVAVLMPVPGPSRGDRIRVVGSIQVIGPPGNPGEFDAQAWMAGRGITCEMELATSGDLAIERKASPHSLWTWADRCREWMEKTLRTGIAGDPVVCDLLAGMVLGVTSGMPDSLQQEFRNTGTYHLFSVSGLHVGMIAVLLWQFLKLTGIGRGRAVMVIIPALFFYALLTGWKPSSVRAAVMSAIFLIGMTSLRQPIPFNSLCAAAFLILLQWTGELFNTGFQLSFLVVASILLLALPLHRLIRMQWHPDPFVPRQLWTRRERWGAEGMETVGGLVAVSLAAWVGSFPLTLFYFHLVSFSALPTNIVIVPLAFVIMATACLALLGGVFSGTLSAIFNNANWLFSKLLLGIVHVAAGFPGSSFYVGSPASAPVVVTVFDFGAGGAAGIEAGGKVWLLDCGSKWHLDGVIIPWLHSRGKSTPDGVLLSHGDARHIGGALELLEREPPGALMDSMVDDRSPVRGTLHRRLAELGLPKSLCRTGDSLRISDKAVLHVLFPPPGLARDKADDKALVVRLDAGRCRVLFLSDSGPFTQEWLLKNARSGLRADVLVKGTHGSGMVPDTAFVDAVGPKVIVTTGALFPESEVPSAAWIARMEQRGIRVFRQDVSGAVTLGIHPSFFQATGFRDGEEVTIPLE